MGNEEKKLTGKHYSDIIIIGIGLLMSFVSVLVSTWFANMSDNKWKIIITIVGFLGFLLGVIFAYRSIKSKKWTECTDFANTNPDRICKAVRKCIINNRTEKIYGVDISKFDSHFIQQSAINLFSEYLELVEDFLRHYARGNLRMTLPKNPYDQIYDPDNYTDHKRRFSENPIGSMDYSTDYTNLKQALTLIEGKGNRKIIILSISKNNTFIDRIYDDFIRRVKPSEFEKYISLHNEKNVKLEWIVIDDKTYNEYILVGESVYLEIDYSNNIIKIQFDTDIISTGGEIFENKRLQSTKNFLNDFIKPEFIDRVTKDNKINELNTKNEIINNFKKMLKKIK